VWLGLSVRWADDTRDLCKLDVVALSAQKDDLPIDRTSVDASLVRAVSDIEAVENLVDVFFQQSTGFGVSLQGL
jgi:hypothetical protein